MNHQGIYFSRQAALEEIATITDCITKQVPLTFDHPLRTMNDSDIHSLIIGILQIYLEFSKSRNSPIEYIPDAPK